MASTKKPKVKPEPFAVSTGGPFAAEHALIGALHDEAGTPGWSWYQIKPSKLTAYAPLASADRPMSLRLLRAALERLAHNDAERTRVLAQATTDSEVANFHHLPGAMEVMTARHIDRAVIDAMLKRKLPIEDEDLAAVARSLADAPAGVLAEHLTPTKAIGRAITSAAAGEPSASLRAALAAASARLRADDGNLSLAKQLEALADPRSAGAAAASNAHPFATHGGDVADDLIATEGIGASSLAQLRAFRRGEPFETLGPTEVVGPDQYPMLASSPLRDAHVCLSELLESLDRRAQNDELKRSKPVVAALRGDDASRTALYLAMLERTFAHDAKLSPDLAHPQSFYFFFDYGPGPQFMAMLFDAGVDVPQVVMPTLEWFNAYRFPYYGTEPVRRVAAWVAERRGDRALPGALRDALIVARSQCSDLGDHHAMAAPLASTIDAAIGDGSWLTLAPVEHWAIDATRELAALDAAKAAPWLALLKHCATATAARPTAKWLAAGAALRKSVGDEAFRAALLRWFPRVDAARPRPMVGVSWENVDERQRMHETNGTVLRGLLWLTPDVATPDLTRAVAKLTASAYRKIRGIGPRATKVGNACVYALSAIGDAAAVGQLALLKVKVKFGTAQKEIEKAFDAAALKLGLPRDEIEELGVPSYGMDEVGRRRETFGDGDAAVTATLTVDGKDVALAWTRADGKPLKSVPAKVKSEFKDELKDLQAAAKDAGAMVAAQAERIDGLFLAQRTWPLAAWRERYLDHPLVGTVARRLIWLVDGVACIWHGGTLVDVNDTPIEPKADATVALWHPIDRPEAEVLAWRAWLVRHEVRQPFKQAHREVYVLTEAERRTATYSNRFAGHVLRQHQFNALCAARGWKHKLRLMVDDTYPPAARTLANWNLRAEYWVEGIGDAYGTDTAESGAYLRLSTDQVRFYRVAAAANSAHAGGGGYTTDAAGPGAGDVNAPLPLDQIPPLVLSEVLRDVDLFVGVASVGNDPTWQDGGPEGRYRTYWQTYSFGELTETAKTRRATLETLLPRLTKLRDKWTLDDRFLVIKGSLRSYKIHLGSGNILMEPNDQYLCIVPARGAAAAEGTGGVFLPFEGDGTLSVILSKAFLLAEDAKIKDETITRQIKR